MKLFRNLVCLTLIAVVAGSAVADEKEKKGKRKGSAKAPAATQRFVKDMELTADQKEQVAAIDKQFAAKSKELADKKKAILTADQLKAQRDAQKAAKEAGKTGADARKAVDASVTLTDEQAAAMKEQTKAQAALTGEIVAALKKVLTAEQQEKLPKARAGAKGKGAAGKGKKKKKDDAQSGICSDVHLVFECAERFEECCGVLPRLRSIKTRPRVISWSRGAFSFRSFAISVEAVAAANSFHNIVGSSVCVRCGRNIREWC